MYKYCDKTDQPEEEQWENRGCIGKVVCKSPILDKAGCLCNQYEEEERDKLNDPRSKFKPPWNKVRIMLTCIHQCSIKKTYETATKKLSELL